MSGELELDHPDRFTVAAEGPPGQRLFLLQCVQGPHRLTVKVEKQHVALLASYMARIVREMGRPSHLPEDLEIEQVEEPDWVAGSLGVSPDEAGDRVVVTIEELSDEEADGRVARIALTREQAAAFAIRATQLVEAGRPPCPLCGLPLDPVGHICPRTNGHRPPAT